MTKCPRRVKQIEDITSRASPLNPHALLYLNLVWVIVSHVQSFNE